MLDSSALTYFPSPLVPRSSRQLNLLCYSQKPLFFFTFPLPLLSTFPPYDIVSVSRWNSLITKIRCLFIICFRRTSWHQFLQRYWIPLGKHFPPPCLPRKCTKYDIKYTSRLSFPALIIAIRIRFSWFRSWQLINDSPIHPEKSIS